MTPILRGILFVLMCRASTAAFTATLPLGITTVAAGGIVPYNIIVDNTPPTDEYNGAGTFKAITAGVYSVSVSMMSGLSVTSHLAIWKNNERLVWLFTGIDYDMASQTINVNLAVNDLITVRMELRTSQLYSVYNTFSAVKIA